MAPGAPYRVMVVDDSAVVHGLLMRLFESDPSITEAGGEEAVLEAARRLAVVLGRQ